MFQKLISYYKNLKQPVKASLWFALCGFLQKGISMLTTPLFTRVMTEAEYGQFATYNSWFSILQIIVSLNLAAGVYTRGLVKNEKDADRFSGTMLGLSTTCIAVWAVIYGLLHNVINNFTQMSTILMCALFADIWAHAAFQFWSNRERVSYRYKKLILVTLSYVILRPALSLVAVFWVNTELQMEARVIATVLVNLALFTGLYFSIFKKGRHFFSEKYWVYALKFNLPLIPHYLSQVVLNQSDRIMINDICGESFAAYYSVAYTLAMVLQILNTSISGTMNPWIYKSIRDGKTDRIAKTSYAVLVLIAAANFVVVAAAPEILHILAPSNYQAAMWVIPPVTVSVYFMFLYNLFATFEYYFEKTRYVMIASLSGAVLNIVLNMIFIRIFGFVAAGYTTLVCYILYAAAHYLFMSKVCKKELPDKKIYNPIIILVIGAALIICSGATMLVYNFAIVRYLLVTAIGLAAIIFRKRIIKTVKEMK